MQTPNDPRAPFIAGATERLWINPSAPPITSAIVAIEDGAVCRLADPDGQPKTVSLVLGPEPFGLDTAGDLAELLAPITGVLPRGLTIDDDQCVAVPLLKPIVDGTTLRWRIVPRLTLVHDDRVEGYLVLTP